MGKRYFFQEAKNFSTRKENFHSRGRNRLFMEGVQYKRTKMLPFRSIKIMKNDFYIFSYVFEIFISKSGRKKFLTRKRKIPIKGRPNKKGIKFLNDFYFLVTQIMVGIIFNAFLTTQIYNYTHMMLL